MRSASTGSTGAGVSGATKLRGGALARYVFAATLVHSADGGAVVAIVLLAHSQGLPGWVAGLLGASITAPHLLGPFIGRKLDTARDGCKVIAFSAVLHGLLLGAAALLIPAGAFWTAVLLFGSGVFGPMLTGGISSRLPSIAGPEQRSQRRAQSWDVATYGLSATLGPATVAWIAAITDPLTAVMVLAAAAVLGAGAVLALPKQEPPHAATKVPSPAQTLCLMWKNGPLRRTLGLTVAVASSVAALPIYAVAIAPALGGAPPPDYSSPPMGAGNFLGSAGLMVRPLRGGADRLMSLLAVFVAVTLTAVVFTPTLAASLVTFCFAGVANALFFAATLAARSEFAPSNPAARSSFGSERSKSRAGQPEPPSQERQRVLPLGRRSLWPQHSPLWPRPGVIVIGPTYQLLIDVPRAIGADVTEARLRRENDWQLDLSEIRNALRPDTRLVVANFPHNPTGSLTERAVFAELLDLVDGTEAFLLSDEIYRGIQLDPLRQLPSAAAMTPNAITVGGVSKVLGMAGVRIGWTVTQNAAVTVKLLDHRYWTTLATSAPSEVLAIAGLQAAPALLDRANSLVRTNSAALASFVASTPGWDWIPTVEGTCAYPWLTDSKAQAFSEWLVEHHGVLLAADIMFQHTGQHLRFGLGRAQFQEGLATLAQAWPRWKDAAS